MRELFEKRGLAVRDPGKMGRKLPNGQIAPYVPKTPAEIDAFIAAATKIKRARTRLDRSFRVRSNRARRMRAVVADQLPLRIRGESGREKRVAIKKRSSVVWMLRGEVRKAPGGKR